MPRIRGTDSTGTRVMQPATTSTRCHDSVTRKCTVVRSGRNRSLIRLRAIPAARSRLLENFVALDREDTLKKAEKLLRQGRIDNAIAEYLRVVEDQPRDWNTANTLGDLYARVSQPAKAVAQYARIADHFFQDGFYPKAAALYKKILKLVPDEESAQLQLAEISVRLGLLKDAKTYYGAVASRRRARGDVRGAEEIVV